MKRRLNIFCVIVMLVLGFSVLETGYYAALGFQAGVKASMGEEKREEVMHMKFVHLLPAGIERGAGFFRDSVYNAKSGSYVPAAYSSLMVSVPTSPSPWLMGVEGLLSILQLGVLLWAVVLFVRLVVSINRSDIFNWRNVRRLHRIGIALVTGFCCTLASAWLNIHSLEGAFALEGYRLSMTDAVSTTLLVLGLCALIVGEVFAIGLRMKEEQELTI